jgi:hypothetical protein
MFDHIKTAHYGRSVKQYHNWSLNSFAVNRLYYIHSGNLTVLLDNVPHALKPGYIYLIPQNLQFELLLTPETRVDHTFLDFVSLPAIKMDSYIEIDPRQYSLIQKAAQILFELSESYPTYLRDDHTEYIPLVESYLENTLFLINQEFPIHTIADTRGLEPPFISGVGCAPIVRLLVSIRRRRRVQEPHQSRRPCVSKVAKRAPRGRHSTPFCGLSPSPLERADGNHCGQTGNNRTG